MSRCAGPKGVIRREQTMNRINVQNCQLVIHNYIYDTRRRYTVKLSHHNALLMLYQLRHTQQ